jgi:hypothetical protein
MNNTVWKIGVAIIFLILTLIYLQRMNATNNPRFGELLLLLVIIGVVTVVSLFFGKKEGRW